MIVDRGLSDNVELLGFVPDDLLPHIYRAADLSIVPTQALEGFGLIALEALAAGTPVIVSPVGGPPGSRSGPRRSAGARIGLRGGYRVGDRDGPLRRCRTGFCRLPRPCEDMRLAAHRGTVVGLGYRKALNRLEARLAELRRAREIRSGCGPLLVTAPASSRHHERSNISALPHRP